MGHLPDAEPPRARHHGQQENRWPFDRNHAARRECPSMTPPNPDRTYPLLTMLDGARGEGALPFARDPLAAALERRAHALADAYWPETVWLIGAISPELLDAVALRLEAERQALHARVRVFVAAEHPTAHQA
jgi:hypothetical protein